MSRTARTLVRKLEGEGKTVKLFKEAEDFVTNLAAEGKTILFVGTKRQAQDVIAEESVRCGMYHVNQRWLGGLLTNFNTIQRHQPEQLQPKHDGNGVRQPRDAQLADHVFHPGQRLRFAAAMADSL